MTAHTDLELTLCHDGCNWIVDGFNHQLYGQDLHILENKIIQTIDIDPRFNDSESVNVTLQFDMDQFPKWLHQYQSHYFNYSFTVNRQHIWQQ